MSYQQDSQVKDPSNFYTGTRGNFFPYNQNRLHPPRLNGFPTAPYPSHSSTKKESISKQVPKSYSIVDYKVLKTDQSSSITTNTNTTNSNKNDINKTSSNSPRLNQQTNSSITSTNNNVQPSLLSSTPLNTTSSNKITPVSSANRTTRSTILSSPNTTLPPPHSSSSSSTSSLPPPLSSTNQEMKTSSSTPYIPGKRIEINKDSIREYNLEIKDSKQYVLRSSYNLPILDSPNATGASSCYNVSTDCEFSMQRKQLDGIGEYQKWTNDVVEPFIKVSKFFSFLLSFFPISFSLFLFNLKSLISYLNFILSILFIGFKKSY